MLGGANVTRPMPKAKLDDLVNEEMAKMEKQQSVGTLLVSD